jgi:two-component system OmpR family response regulator
MLMRILVAEDNIELAGQVKHALSSEGHAVDLTADGEEAEFLGETEPYDLIILDIGLPKQDGISVLKSWRDANINIPVLILTARDGWTDRVDGLDAGADDYLTKPFHIPELIARVRALLRRNSIQRSPVFRKSGVSFDSRSGRVSLNGSSVMLTAPEAAVLSYLFHNANRPITSTELSEHIYEHGDDRDSNTIAVFVTRLRKKLGNDLIETERGRGYSIQLVS